MGRRHDRRPILSHQTKLLYLYQLHRSFLHISLVLVLLALVHLLKHSLGVEFEYLCKPCDILIGNLVQHDKGFFKTTPPQGGDIFLIDHAPERRCLYDDVLVIVRITIFLQKRVFYKSFQEMIGDLDCVVTRAAGENCGAPPFLLGHSMGGMIASLYATKYPDRISGVVLTGARTRFNHSEWAEILPLDEAEETCHETSFGIGLCTDPEVVKAYRADPLVEKHYTAGIRNSCWNGVLWQKAHAGDFTVPVLIMHGEADSIVSPEESGDFFREIGSRDKTLRICAGLYHEILNEPCRDTVIGEITSWLDWQLFSEIPNPEISAHPAATKAERH